MAIEDKIGDEKLQCGINRKSVKKSPLWSRKIYKQEYLTEILPYDQKEGIESAKFTHFL